MTYDEFAEKLTWYFSRRDIEDLNRLAYEEAKTALTEDFTIAELYNMGREFIVEQLIGDSESCTVEDFRAEIKQNTGIEMTESNAAALLADLESGAF